VETINKKMRDGVFEEFPEYVIGYKDGEYIFEEVEDAAP
jgi:hypothetical protein